MASPLWPVVPGVFESVDMVAAIVGAEVVEAGIVVCA